MGHRIQIVALISMVAFIVGCGGDGAASNEAASGKVTFNGTPVGEGTITFYNEQDSSGNTAEIAADGSYSLDAPAGTYSVYLEPPMIPIESEDGEGDTDEDYKPMPNMPEKYRNSATSGFKTTLPGGKFDFDMTE